MRLSTELKTCCQETRGTTVEKANQHETKICNAQEKSKASNQTLNVMNATLSQNV